MTDPQVALVMIGLLVFLIMLGFPIAFTLLGMGVGFGYYAYYTAGQAFYLNRVFDLMVQNTFNVMSNDVLTAIPLFLFMGYVVERTNIIDKLFYSIEVAAKRIPASMAVATIVTCALFATATGIVGAVVTLMGLLAFPAMLRAKYDTSFAAGAVCAGGCLGILIPPSIMLIVYGATSGVSVVRLYAGALLPGFMLAGFYVVYVMALGIWRPHLAPKLPENELNVPFPKLMYLLLTSFFPLAILILAVLGAIMFGLATPSEAAAVGSLGSLVLGAAYRALTWERLKESVYLTVRASAMVCWLFVGSATFAAVFGYLGGQKIIEEFVVGMNLSPLVFLIVCQLIIFVLGWPLEWTEIIIIFVPIFLPLLKVFEIDPLLFGILVALNLQTSFLTPPVAMAAYYLKGVAPPEVTLDAIFKGVMPYQLIVILAMVVLYIFPEMATWLPGVIYGAR
jgi:tripartite ATP-independent transporter DctM subunit